MKLLYITNCIIIGGEGIEMVPSAKPSMRAVDFSQGESKAIGVYSQTFDILPFTQGLVFRTLYPGLQLSNTKV